MVHFFEEEGDVVSVKRATGWRVMIWLAMLTEVSAQSHCISAMRKGSKELKELHMIELAATAAP